jgi:hypothetical protein
MYSPEPVPAMLSADMRTSDVICPRWSGYRRIELATRPRSGTDFAAYLRAGSFSTAREVAIHLTVQPLKAQG